MLGFLLLLGQVYAMATSNGAGSGSLAAVGAVFLVGGLVLYQLTEKRTP